MGLAASQARYLLLTAQKSDRELDGQRINQRRTLIANAINKVFALQAGLEPDSSRFKQLEAEIGALHSLDQSLELQLRRVDTQQRALQTELDAVKKVIDKNIDATFKTFA